MLVICVVRSTAVGGLRVLAKQQSVWSYCMALHCASDSDRCGRCDSFAHMLVICFVRPTAVGGLRVLAKQNLQDSKK